MHTSVEPFVTFDDVGDRTIATRAKLMSLRIINDTRNPDHDRKYRTNRAGIRSVNERFDVMCAKNEDLQVNYQDRLVVVCPLFNGFDQKTYLKYSESICYHLGGKCWRHHFGLFL